MFVVGFGYGERAFVTSFGGAIDMGSAATAIPLDEWVEPLRFRPEPLAPRHLRVVLPDERRVVPSADPARVSYARRRLAAALLAAAVLAVVLWVAPAVGSLVAGGADASPSAPLPPSSRVHVGGPGETEWSIASSVAGPSGDARPVVDALVRQHGGATLRV